MIKCNRDSVQRYWSVYLAGAFYVVKPLWREEAALCHSDCLHDIGNANLTSYPSWKWRRRSHLSSPESFSRCAWNSQLKFFLVDQGIVIVLSQLQSLLNLFKPSNVLFAKNTLISPYNRDYPTIYYSPLHPSAVLYKPVWISANSTEILEALPPVIPWT